jgi:hypothetical protein
LPTLHRPENGMKTRRYDLPMRPPVGSSYAFLADPLQLPEFSTRNFGHDLCDARLRVGSWIDVLLSRSARV